MIFENVCEGHYGGLIGRIWLLFGPENDMSAILSFVIVFIALNIYLLVVVHLKVIDGLV